MKVFASFTKEETTDAEIRAILLQCMEHADGPIRIGCSLSRKFRLRLRRIVRKLGIPVA
jgi:hypothetical protein